MRPNFVFILADDLGYADLGCYGGRGSQAGGRSSCSPHLDRLAKQGLRFTQGYANSAVCSPTRFALMTGRWQHRLRGGADEPIRSGPARGDARLGLPPAHPTLPSLLRGAGYATGLVGKWHLGFAPHFGPLKSGYDEFFGSLSGAQDYFTHCDPGGVHDLFEGEQEVFRKGYLTDLITAKAVSFIKRKRQQPFLLSVHYNAPHWPWETRADAAEAKRIAQVPSKIYHFDGGSLPAYLTMIRQMDEGIGRILAELKKLKLEKNTVVVFTSDNGGERYADTWPLVGKKMDLLEGGIRVPYIVRWPEMVKQGGVTAQHAVTMDWVATFLDAAGVKPHRDYPLDGISLLPILKNPKKLKRRDLYWKMLYREQKALRSGDWKYFSVEGNEFLFNLAADERERANYAQREAKVFALLKEKYLAWEAQLPNHPDAAYAVPATRADLAVPSS
jgi:arylsulfatase A-like enzyme